MAPASTSPSNNEALHQRVVALEQALKASQEQATLLQAVLDSIPEVIYATNVQGRIRAVNTAFVTWLGRPRDEIVAAQLSDLFPPDLVTYWNTQAQTVQQTGAPLVVEEDVPDATGMRTYLSQRFPLRYEHGEIYAIAGTATDISERKQAEQALRENQRLLGAIIDNAPAVIHVKSPDGQLLVVN